MEAVKTAEVRHVCYTLNNYTEEDYQKLIKWRARYHVVGKEIGEEGTPHLQGYFEFTNSKKWQTLKNFNQRIHWEIRRGTPKEASEYCKKDGDFLEIGTISSQGERNDLEDIKKKLDNKVPMIKIAQEHFGDFLRYNKSFEKYLMLSQKHREEPPIITWYWGLAGVGKTSIAYDKHKGNVYIKDGTQWWDGYSQEEAIIIDDFDGKWPYRDLLRLLDRYPYQGQVKGGYVKINSKFIYITCEHPPQFYWQGNALAQVKRRLNLTAEVTGNTIGRHIIIEDD